MSSFDVLGTLIGQLPEPMRPTLTQLGQMLKAMKDELTSHSADNQGYLNVVATQLTQVASRVSNVESSMTGFSTLLTGVSSRLDDFDKRFEAMDQFLGSSSTLDQAPTILALKAKIEHLLRLFSGDRQPSKSLLSSESSRTNSWR